MKIKENGSTVCERFAGVDLNIPVGRVADVNSISYNAIDKSIAIYSQMFFLLSEGSKEGSRDTNYTTGYFVREIAQNCSGP